MAKSTPPSLHFLLAHPAHLVACGFGSGLSPWAPGTIGTLFAWLTYLLIRPNVSEIVFIILLVIAYIVGIALCEQTGKDLGEADHGSIVWDEIVPFWGLLFVCPADWRWQLTAFLLFRLFDILKPPPANYFDNIKSGFGVMADDLVAAGYALLVLFTLRILLGN